MRRGKTAIGLLLSVVAAIVPTSASAATEVGNDCEVSGMMVGATIFPLTNATSSSLPVSVPAAGIATKWIVRAQPNADTHAERLKVFRPTSDPHQFEVIAESSLENVAAGRNSFDIRVPVLPGDRFGVAGRAGGGALACIPPHPGDVEGIFLGDSPVGSTVSFTEDETGQAAVTAMVEPDADLDEYGDETQDRCPRSGYYWDHCPHVTIAFWADARRRYSTG